ncbi:porin family protein [Vogesella sp. LIG4]|uniref:porin family protein n=1 Tax=Vogesella sp. LIG4 TaxID=1192162 RepID=UPI00081F78D9|nr:porin family protein [Vogesella sp. LIG4]SCK14983.1 Opacity protein [Vogesella sp. LIG4]
MKKLLIASVLIAAGTSAYAADTGTYVFGNLGASTNQWTLKDGAASRAGVSSTKVDSDDATKGMAEIGVGKRINDNFAVEGSYLRNGDAVPLNGAGKLDYDSFRAAALGIIPVNDKFEVYGKVSANYLHSSFTSSNPALSSGKDDNFSLGLGVGAAYKLNKQVSLRAEYETLGDIKHKNITDTAPVSVLKAGVAYMF